MRFQKISGKNVGMRTGRRVAIVADSDGAMARLQPTAKLVLHDVTVHTRFGVISHVRIATSVDKGVRTNTYGHANGDAEAHTTSKPWFNHLLFRVALDALEHRDVAQVYRVLERFVCFVTGFAFPSRQTAQINRVFEVDRLGTCGGPR